MSIISENKTVSSKPEIHLNFEDKLQLLCVFYISVWAISPPLAYGTGYRVIAILCAFVWFSIELLRRPDTIFKPTYPTLCALVYIFYSGAIGYLYDGLGDLVHNFQVYLFLLFLIFYESYKKRDIRQLRFIFLTTLVLFPIWLGITLNELNVNAHVARILVRSTAESKVYMAKGVGGYGLIYSVLVYLPMILYLILMRVRVGISSTFPLNRKIWFVILVLNLVLSIGVIFKAGYTIAIILMLLGGIVFFVIRKNTFSGVVVFIALSFLVTFQIGPTLDSIYDLSQGTKYDKKVSDIRSSFYNEESVGTVNIRSERYIRSINLFFENPVIGTLTFEDIGKHSAILDRFARYGLFVGAMFAFTVFYLPLYYMKNLKFNYGVMTSFMFIIVGYAFLNNITATLGYVVFIFYPVALSYVHEYFSTGKRYG